MTVPAKTLARIALAAALALGALAGCAAQPDDLAPCALNPANAAEFTYGSTGYVILGDVVAQSEIGTWAGRLHVNAAVDAQGAVVAQQSLADTLRLDMDKLAAAADTAVGIVSYVNVYEPRDAPPHDSAPLPVLLVDVDESVHRAVPTSRLTSADRPFDPAAAAAATHAPSSFAVNPQNATQLLSGSTCYQVDDAPLADGSVENPCTLLGVIAASVTYDADTLRPLSRGELLSFDWSGQGRTERRETRFYGEVRALADADPLVALAVEIDGVWFVARAR